MVRANPTATAITGPIVGSSNEQVRAGTRIGCPLSRTDRSEREGSGRRLVAEKGHENSHSSHDLYAPGCRDGAFLISGHQIYCPEPVLVTLVEPPRIGRKLIFRPVDPEVRRVTKHVVTTPVMMIEGVATCATSNREIRKNWLPHTSTWSLRVSESPSAMDGCTHLYRFVYKGRRYRQGMPRPTVGGAA